MRQKVSPQIMKKYIEKTHEMNEEYRALVAEQSAIFADLSDNADIPARVDEINRRIDAIKNTMQSNAVILADFLQDVLSQRVTE